MTTHDKDVDRLQRMSSEPNAHFAVDIRAEAFLDLLVERLNWLS